MSWKLTAGSCPAASSRSVGCILAEMILGKPIFPGKDRESAFLLAPALGPSADDSSRLPFRIVDVNQFSIITELIGTPPDDVIKTICSENVRRPAPCAACPLRLR